MATASSRRRMWKLSRNCNVEGGDVRADVALRLKTIRDMLQQVHDEI